ncbi:MAG: hypothetical protein IEMM0006_0289 [bacterium]|nr:MAG: hypothetical protein IEMM0006_0289 [bacterium]
MNKNGRHKFLSKFYLSCAGLFLTILAFYIVSYTARTFYKPQSQVKKTVKTFYLIGTQFVNTQKRMFNLFGQKKALVWKNINAELSDNQQLIVVKRNDSIIYWNSNQVPVKQMSSMLNAKIKILQSNKHWYIGLKTRRKNITIASFYLLSEKNLPYGVKVENKNKTGKDYYPLKEFNISVQVKPDILPQYLLTILFFLYLSAFLFLALILYLIYEWIAHRLHERYSLLLFLSFAVDLVILRAAERFLGFPQVLTNSVWRSDQITNIPGLSTPGDLFLDFILLCLVLFMFFRYLNRQQKRWKSNIFLKAFPVQFITFSFPLFLYYMAENILHSGGFVSLSENVYFNRIGIIRLLLFLVVNLLLYPWLNSFLRFLKRKSLTYVQFSVSLFIVGVIYFLTLPIEKTIIFLTFSIVLTLSMVIWFFERIKRPYIHSLLAILLLSASAAYLLNVNGRENRNAHQRFTANMLTQKQDPYLQYLLHNLSGKILKDTNVIKVITSKRENKEQWVTNYLNKKYFHGMLLAYSRQITLCEPGQRLEIQPENKVVGCDAFFNQLRGKVVLKRPDFELSLVNNTSESIYYLARFYYPQTQTRKVGVNLYIEFFTNIIPKGLGYPELLQDASASRLHLSGYSFAFYQQGKLEYKFGDFLFPIDLTYFKNVPERKFFTKDAYKHFLLPVSKKEILIVSRPQLNLSGWLLPFSLLFILSGIVLLIYTSFTYGKQILETFRYSFSTRLQLTIFTTMLIVFLTLTAVILYYFNTNNRNIISNNLKEKTHSVLIELQDKLSSSGSVGLKNRQEIQIYLQKFSMVFFTDINLYDNAGWLIASSRPEIFNKGLQSKLMNPKAYEQIEKNHKLFYLGKEKIKNVSFYSSYAPFILDNGKDVGVLNLPYFARQYELQHSYYQMLANLINLFVITGMLGMLLMVYLSRLLTRPLQILQHKITSVSIEKQNEKIEWGRNDEIGKLITAYNQMVEKLEESARLLKYSAREKAWREMARQIAHEIRNPLTPMKLNVQYLQKVYAAKDSAFDEKLRTISQSLINQIDTLDEVAGMFSDFSKINFPLDEKADLMQAIKSTTTLFKKSYEINIEIDSDREYIPIKTSKQDLLRIFNNLLKNAVQSMENVSRKELRIQIICKKFHAELRLTDNGKGISAEDKKNIFQPYFTTKSKGTGLGLAIVKNLMTEMGGEVTFVSEEGNGTTFILLFPLSTK